MLVPLVTMLILTLGTLPRGNTGLVESVEAAWIDSEHAHATFTAASLTQPQNLECAIQEGRFLIFTVTDSLTLTWEDNQNIQSVYKVRTIQDGVLTETPGAVVVENGVHRSVVLSRSNNLITLLGELLGILSTNTFELHVWAEAGSWKSDSASVQVVTQGLVSNLLLFNASRCE